MKQTAYSKTLNYRKLRNLYEGKPNYTEEDMFECFICHNKYVLLGSHVVQTHKMLMIEYKLKFGLDTKRGRTRGQFRKLKADTNMGISNLEKGAKYRFHKGEEGAGKYTRSPETMVRLKRLQKDFGGRSKKIK